MAIGEQLDFTAKNNMRYIKKRGEENEESNN